MVTLMCRPGYIINGSMETMCNDNGNWNPDPRDVKCIGKSILINLKLHSSSLTLIGSSTLGVIEAFTNILIMLNIIMTLAGVDGHDAKHVNNKPSGVYIHRDLKNTLDGEQT